MAEALVRARLSGRHGAQVASAGLAARIGESADPIAQELVAERGLDLSGHRARQLTPDLMSSFDLVLVMEAEHVRAAEELSPAMRGRVHRIGKFASVDVPDPYGRGHQAFAAALSHIERGLEGFERAFWSR